MTCKHLVVLAALAGCNYHFDLPATFTAEIIAPVPTYDASNGEHITCSISDPVAAIAVESHGCNPWTTVVSRSDSEQVVLGDVPISAAVHAAISDLATLTSEAPFGASLTVAAQCDGVNVFLPVTLDVAGIRSVEASIGAVSKIVPYGGGLLVGVGDSSISVFDPMGSDAVTPGFFETSASGTLSQLGAQPDVFVDHDDIVVTETCVESWCKADGRFVVAIPGGDFTSAVVQSLAGAFVGALVPHRLAFYVTSSTGDSILLTDAGLASPKSIPVPYTGGHASLLSGRDSDGALVVAVATPDSQLHVVRVDPTTETAAVEALGAATVSPTRLWVSPDGSYVVYGYDQATGTFAVRGVDDTTDRFQFASAVVADEVQGGTSSPVFLDGLLLSTDLHDHVVAYDPTGNVAWSALVPGLIEALSIAADDAHVVVTASIGVFVLDGEGHQSFAQPNVPYSFDTDTLDQSWWVGDAAGHLYLARDDSNYVDLLAISTADSSFTAPPTSCSQLDCGSGTTDLGSDPDNCGLCGHRCGDGNQCVAGACQGGCAGELVDLSVDPQNCGTCGHACANPFCAYGVCTGD